jgi:hypothetical protein
MDFYKYIAELLYDHDCVVVPGLGGFVTNYSPAKIHPVLHTFSPPRKAILFNARLRSNDGVLAHYIAEKEKISYDQALFNIKQFAENILGLIEKKRNAEIVKVGVLFQDAEGILQFEPSKEVNYLLSSFGLTEFVSPAIQRRVFPSRQDRRLYDRPVVRRDRRIPVALKRAIWIGLPVLALLIAGSLSINTLKQIYTQYSNVFPDFVGQKEKIENEKSPANLKTITKTNISDNKTFRSADNKKSNVIRSSNKEKQTGNTETKNSSASLAAHKFYIVGNCFLIEENAKKYIRSLKEKGYDGAGYFLPPKKKLFRAYFSSFNDRADAEPELKSIREKETPDAWLLEL